MSEDSTHSEEAKPGVEPSSEASAEKSDEAVEVEKKTGDPNKTKEKSSSGDEEVVIFQGKVELHCNVRLPQYDVDLNQAYKAVAKDKVGTGLYAIVCERHFVPRLKDVQVYSSIINPNITSLVLHGPVYWPPAKQERYVFVYLDNLGEPILGVEQPQLLGWKPDDVMSVVVEPVVNVLQDFQDKDFVHGAIRPSNMFGAGGAGPPKKIMLGECLSMPASSAQPIFYETVERSMVDPIARGKGTLVDDLYAFGVSLAVCLRTSDPMKGLSGDDIIRRKIELGSYAAITGKDRFKGEILELLRGLLHDDSLQRWTIDEVITWMDGTRLSPKQALVRKKSSRPLNFSDGKYILAEILAMDIDTNPNETKRIVEDGSLMQWLKRSLEDEELMEKAEKAIETAKQGGTGAGFEDRLVSNLSTVLDPLAPLRFKHLRVTADGLGAAISEAIILKQDIKVFAEILTNGLMLNWLTLQGNPNIDVQGLFTKYEQCRRHMRSVKLGDGIERCAYLLSPETHCLSEVLQPYFVTNPKHMLVAFEKLCQKKQAPKMFLDRHSIAFLMQKDSAVVENVIYDLNLPEEHKVILGNLKCLAEIQKRYEVKKTPGISSFFAGKLASVYERYHDRNVRDKIQKAIEDISDAGDLQKMMAVLDNIDLINKDEKAYRKALEEFAGLQKEKEDLEEKLKDQESFGVETGQEVAAVVAAVFAAIIIIGAAMVFFSG